MVSGFYRFYGLTIFPIDHGKLVVVLSIGLLGSGSRLLLGVLLGEAYWVLFRFLYWGQFVDPCLIIAGNYLVGSSVSECLV